MAETARQQKATPQLEDIELISEGWINKYLLTYRMPDGGTFRYESTSRKKLEAYRAELMRNAEQEAPTPDAVCIVPVLPDKSLLLIREFRYPLNSWCIAFPAGLIEPGEDLAESIDRELREETGYRVRRELGGSALMPLPQSGYSSTGMTEENVQVVIAQVEPQAAGAPEPEPTEFIEPFILKREDVAAFLEENATPIGTRCQLLLEAAKRATDF